MAENTQHNFEKHFSFQEDVKGLPLRTSDSLTVRKHQSMISSSFQKAIDDSDEAKRTPPQYRYSISGWFKSITSMNEPEPEGHRVLYPFKKEKGRDPLIYVSRLPLATTSMPVHKSQRPKKHKAKIVIWSDLSLFTLEHLNESTSADYIKEVLASMFMLDHYKDNLKEGIIVDLYYYTLRFAKDEDFSPEKTSTLFSIIKKLFEVCIETPYGNVDHTFEYFKDLLICHSVHHPPWSIDLFTTEEVMKIMDYTINTFFRHFKLYKYVFTPTVRLNLTLNYIGMPPSPPPLSPPVPPPTAVHDAEVTAEEEDSEKVQEVDAEKLLAEGELRRIVTEFLTREAKKIEGNVDQHLKHAINVLTAKIDAIVETGPKDKGKKKI